MDGPPKLRIRLSTENVSNIPTGLRALKQWVCWQIEMRGGKPTKVPYQTDSQHADSTDPGTWSNFDDALAAYQAGRFDGVGFVFSNDGPYCGVDIDGCRDPESGIIAPEAKEIIETLGSYSEVSPSGCGVKVFLKARKPGPKCRKPYAGGHVEIYDAGRYFTVTGKRVDGAPTEVEHRQAGLEAVYAKVFGDKRVADEPAAAGATALADDEIIAKASNGRKNGEEFRSLWDGRWEGNYPSQSEADLALVSMLCFYTKDAAQVDRLFRRSKLMRPKWDTRHGELKYGEMTVRKALATVDAQYDPHKRPDAQAGGSGHAISSLPKVLLPGGIVPISEAAGKLGPLLAATRRYYVRGGAVVALDSDDEKVPILKPVMPAALTSILEGVAVLKKFVKQGTDYVEVETTCSEQTAKLLMHAEAFLSELPPIRVLTRCPVLVERNGWLVQMSGYDRESGILAAGDPAPDVPLDAAVEMLSEMLAEFRFATPSDRSRALASFITPALVFGGLLRGRAPVDLAEADKSQAGKGFKNKLGAAIYHAKIKTITQRKGGVGSLAEAFDTALVQGRPFISLDNIRGDVDLPSLESLMTEDAYQARVPYLAPVEIDPRRIVVMMTSNKAEVTVDLANRSSCTRILKQEPGYRFRTYPEGDILDHVRANQPAYLGAVFAVVRAWHAAGKPRSQECRHDFRPWAQRLDWIVQEILHAAPLLEGHRETQARIANPNLNWLRDVALAVRRAGYLGQWGRANNLVDVVSDSPDVEVPGLPEGGDINDEETRKKVLQGLGRKLALCFAGEDTITIDDMVVTRRESQDSIGRPVREYRFEIDVSGSRYAPEPHSESIGRSIARNDGGLEKQGAQASSLPMASLYKPPSNSLSKSPFPLCSAIPPNISCSGFKTGNQSTSSGTIEISGIHSENSEVPKTCVKSMDEDWEEI